jgi:hypothetical protein
MIKRFVLNYIRTHMGHNNMNTRAEIFQAINEGCRKEFYEDTPASRISWVVGELVKQDKEFIKQNAPTVACAVSYDLLQIMKGMK